MSIESFLDQYGHGADIRMLVEGKFRLEGQMGYRTSKVRILADYFIDEGAKGWRESIQRFNPQMGEDYIRRKDETVSLNLGSVFLGSAIKLIDELLVARQAKVEEFCSSFSNLVGIPAEKFDFSGLVLELPGDDWSRFDSWAEEDPTLAVFIKRNDQLPSDLRNFLASFRFRSFTGRQIDLPSFSKLRLIDSWETLAKKVLNR